MSKIVFHSLLSTTSRLFYWNRNTMSIAREHSLISWTQPAAYEAATMQVLHRTEQFEKIIAKRWEAWCTFSDHKDDKVKREQTQQRGVVHPAAAHRSVSFIFTIGEDLLCVIIRMQLGRSLPWAEGGKEWGIVTCEQAGNDPDSLGSLEQTRRYKSLSPTAILPLSRTDPQHLSLSICPPAPPHTHQSTETQTCIQACLECSHQNITGKCQSESETINRQQPV